MFNETLKLCSAASIKEKLLVLCFFGVKEIGVKKQLLVLVSKNVKFCSARIKEQLLVLCFFGVKEIGVKISCLFLVSKNVTLVRYM